MLTQDQINRFSAKAKASGYSDAQIAAEIARKKKELETPPVTQPVSSGMNFQNPGFAQETPAPTPAPQKGGLFSNIKSAFSGFGQKFFPATANFVQDVGAGLGVRSKDQQQSREANQAAQEKVNEIIQRATKETDPTKKRKLLDFAKTQGARLEDIQKASQPAFSKDVEKSAAERGLAVSAELAPLVVTPTGVGKTAVRRVISAAGQGATLSGLRSATSLEDMTPEERLNKTLVDAGLGALIVGGVQAGGELLKGTASKAVSGGNKTKEIGGELRQGVRKIHEPAGVWSASKEEAINKTLDKSGISGTAGEQYKQLEPAYEKLTEAIRDYLKKKSVPVDSADVVSQIKTDLADIPGNVLADKQGKLEYSKITKEVVKQVQDSQGLFSVKQWLNGRLGRVYTKLEKGNPLSPAEEVLLQTRDTVDQMITKLHPKIKDLTIEQSHLRDAAPSLAKARLTVPTTRIGGSTIPVPISQRIQDTAGKVLQNIGGKAEAMGQKVQSGLDFLKSPLKFTQAGIGKAAPILLTPSSLPFNGAVNPEQQGTQNINAQGNANEPQNQPGHMTNISQTVTGKTVEQHLRALSRAQAAGDKNAVKAITAQLNIEQEFQKNQPSAKKLTATQIRDVNLADNGLRALNTVKSQIMDEKGNIDWVKVTKFRLSPGQVGFRKLYDAVFDATGARLRIESGAAINNEEIKRYVDKYFLRILDSPDAVKYQIDQLEAFLNATKGQGAATSPEDLLGGFSVSQ